MKILIFKGLGTENIDFRGPGTENIDFSRSRNRKYLCLKVQGAKILIFRDLGTELFDF